MSNLDPVDVSQVLKTIETNFGNDAKAQASTVVFLCLVFNPCCSRMLQSSVRNALGGETAVLNNRQPLLDLARALKESPENTRRQIFKYMADILMESNWRNSKSNDEKTDSLKRSYNNEITAILQKDFSMGTNDIKKLADICMNHSINRTVDLTTYHIGTKRSLLGLGAMGMIGGYFGGKAIVLSSLATVGVMSAIPGGAIVAGAMILGAATTIGIAYAAYGIYCLVHACKKHYDMKADQARYLNADQSETPCADTMNAFKLDVQPGEALITLLK